ncbi:MAG: hypothetical protein V1874_12435 [Spirochaetota bacterium]
MKTIDEFGKDPTVQRTRTLFSLMERMDKALQEGLKLSAFDARLGTIRSIRQQLYERCFTRALRKGIYMDEEKALELFSHCQKTAAARCGFAYPYEVSDDPEILILMKEEIS